MITYVVVVGPAWQRSSPFGSLTESYFEQGDEVQAVEEIVLSGHVTGTVAKWAKLANGFFVCVDDGSTQYLVPLAGVIPNREPAKTKPLRRRGDWVS